MIQTTADQDVELYQQATDAAEAGNGRMAEAINHLEHLNRQLFVADSQYRETQRQYDALLRAILDEQAQAA